MNLDSDLRRWGRAMQVGGMVALLLAIIQSGREVVESIAATPFAGAGALDLIHSGLVGLVIALPYLLLLSGLHAVARLGERYHEGEVFSLGNAILIRRFGASLTAAAAAFMVVRPTLLDWIGGISRVFVVQINEAVLPILVAGVFVTAIAHIMSLANRLQVENDSFV